jgi:alanyl-tRNA synthetase
LSKADLDRAEDLANQIIYEDRPVKSYFVAPEQIEAIPLRRPPKVNENIRIIEIDSFDYSACGGTHCPRTGMIGIVKIVKTERQNEKTRILFAAGWQALQQLRESHDIVTTLAGQLSTHPQEILTNLHKQAEQLKAAQRELQALRLERIKFEAQELVAQTEVVRERRLLLASFENRPVNELRALAEALKPTPGLLAVLAAHDGQKVSLVVVSQAETGVLARDLLTRLLAPISGRGGGDATLAQGGGTATSEQYREFWVNLRSLVVQT